MTGLDCFIYMYDTYFFACVIDAFLCHNREPLVSIVQFPFVRVRRVFPCHGDIIVRRYDKLISLPDIRTPNMPQVFGYFFRML